MIMSQPVLWPAGEIGYLFSLRLTQRWGRWRKGTYIGCLELSGSSELTTLSWLPVLNLDFPYALGIRYEKSAEDI